MRPRPHRRKLARMSTAYAPRGLLGVLTPQANTTVEPEFALLMPPGMAVLNARMTSARPTITERLLDYLARLEEWSAQFGNAPLGAIAFACTGASYHAMPEAEDAAVARLCARHGVLFITTATAVCAALQELGARRIGLVSPYPDELTQASIAYWTARGFEVAAVSGSKLVGDTFHVIYAMDEAGATAALLAINPAGLDAIVMLGTGMPTLGAIRAHPRVAGVPVLSCMLALGWASARALGDVRPVSDWVAGEGWGARLDAWRAGLASV
jgi:maleate isomerase